MLRGAQLYGDEMIVMHRREALVTVIARRLSVRERTLDLLGDARVSAIVRSADRVYDGDERTYFVRSVALDKTLGSMPPPLPLGALIVLRRGETAPRLTALSPARTALAAAPFLGSRRGDMNEVGSLIEIVRDAAAFELSAHDPHEAADMLIRVSGRC